MKSTLLCTGLACIIAPIVGGGLKAFGIEMPIVSSTKRQVLLAILGAVLILASFATDNSNQPSTSNVIDNPNHSSPSQPIADPIFGSAKPYKAALSNELESNNRQIDQLQGDITLQEKKISDVQGQVEREEQAISAQKVRLQNGEGTSQERADAQNAIDEAQAQINRTREAITYGTNAENQAREKIGSLKQRNAEIVKELGQ